MTREQRESELKTLAERDKSQFLGIYKRTVDMPGGAMPEVGTPSYRMIEQILDREFPEDSPT